MANFIILSGGTIINVEHVKRISTEMTTHNADGTRNQLTRLDIGSDVEQVQDYPMDYNDPDGKIYAWFAERAVPFGGAEVSRMHGELCYNCDGERSGDHDEKCPHCGEIWAPF